VIEFDPRYIHHFLCTPTPLHKTSSNFLLPSTLHNKFLLSTSEALELRFCLDPSSYIWREDLASSTTIPLMFLETFLHLRDQIIRIDTNNAFHSGLDLKENRR
jgi:hypothetical protein